MREERQSSNEVANERRQGEMDFVHNRCPLYRLPFVSAPYGTRRVMLECDRTCGKWTSCDGEKP